MKVSKVEPLPNIDFNQHNSLFLTQTKSKSKFGNSESSETSALFDKDLHDKITPENYFKPCYNFHSANDKRIDKNNFKDIKSDVKSLFDKKHTFKIDHRKSDSKPLEKNDLMILFESSLQGQALTQSVFEKQAEENLALNIQKDEKNKKIDFHEDESEEDDLKQSFVSFLGNGSEEIYEATKNTSFNKIPELIEKLKFEKKLNFTDSKIIV